MSTKGLPFLSLVSSSVTLSFGIISKTFEIYARMTVTNDPNPDNLIELNIIEEGDEEGADSIDLGEFINSYLDQ